MYHDELDRKSSRPIETKAGSDLAGRALSLGGGLSMGLVASLDRDLAATLLPLGGLLPQVAASLGKVVDRVSDVLTRVFAFHDEPAPTTPQPITALRGPRMTRARTRVRGEFDASRRLG